MKNKNGFSLVELMVAIAIIGILAAIATPNIISWLQNRKYTTSVQRVISVMNAAKMRAVKENMPTIVTFTGNEIRAFIDRNDDSSWSGDGTDKQIDFYEMPHGTSIKSNSKIGFDGQGLVLDSQVGTVELESDRGRSNKAVVNITGRIRLE